MTCLRINWKTACLAALVFVLPAEGRADGGFFYPRYNTMYEYAQQAYLEYDAAAGIERLSILPSFRGDARDFAWIIPVPDLPDIATEDIDLFHALADLTEPAYQRRDGDWDCIFKNRGVVSYDAADGRPVEIVDAQLVGYYRTMTVAANDASALVDTLEAWGFLHPENSEIADEVFTHYVDQSWYFVTVRADSTAFDDKADSYPYYYSRHLEPIRLTFLADGPVYPMRVSAISASADSDVYLYVKAEHRMTFAGAETHYANRLETEDLTGYSANFAEALVRELAPGDYLTKLHREYHPAEMTEDLAIVRAATDDEYRLVAVGGFPWTSVLILAVPVSIAVRRRFWLSPRR